MPVHVDPEVSKELMQTVQQRMSEANKKKEKRSLKSAKRNN